MSNTLKTETNQSFWVIERYVNGRLCYWSAGARGRSSRDDWAEDIQWATRLADFPSSEQVLVYTCAGEGRSVQHQMVATNA